MMPKTEERHAMALMNENEKIFGIFHRPTSDAPYPAVLMCHGMAGNKAGRYRIYVDLAQQLAMSGIAALRIDFRGSGDSEGSFEAMTLKGEVSDALVALAWLQQQAGVDPNRIGLFGRSLGGAVAVMAASEYGRSKSLALWCPIFSGAQWHDKWLWVKQNNAYADALKALRTINGQTAGIAFLEQLFSMQLSPHLDKLAHIPLFHAHGLKDNTVLPTHAEAYKTARESAPALSKFILLPESDHDFSALEEREKVIEETCHWFKSTL